MKKKILVMGLPGAGKTTLSIELAKLLKGVHLNADEIRKEINKDLGFSYEDRLEHAYRMGKFSDIITRSGYFAVADFVCPTVETRKKFGVTSNGNVFVVWVDRIPVRNFEDTTRMFIPPDTDEYDVRVTDEGTPNYWAEYIKSVVEGTCIEYKI